MCGCYLHDLVLVSSVGFFAGLCQSSGMFMDGTPVNARFDSPRALMFHTAKNVLYVSDVQNERIRAITSIGIVTTAAGSGGTGRNDGPSALTMVRFLTPMFCSILCLSCLSFFL